METFFEEWIKKPSRIKVLFYIKNNPGCYATRISKEINMGQQCTWRALKYFREKRLIYSIINKKDYPRKYLYLTKKGKEIIEKLLELEELLLLIS